MPLEKLMRKRNKLDEGRTSAETLAALKGSWRLVFTTGTVDSKKIGKINYFPIKAVQSFDTDAMTLSNGIFLGDYAVLKFFGEWSWQEGPKVEFDFNKLELFNSAFLNLKKGVAAKLGRSSSLGSSNNEELVRGERALLQLDKCRREHCHRQRRWWSLALWKKGSLRPLSSLNRIFTCLNIHNGICELYCIMEVLHVLNQSIMNQVAL